MDYNEMLEILRGKVLHESAEETQQRLNEIADAMERLIRERDEAVNELKQFAFCPVCKHYGIPATENPCKPCIFGSGWKDKWEWRGVQDG